MITMRGIDLSDKSTKADVIVAAAANVANNEAIISNVHFVIHS